MLEFVKEKKNCTGCGACYNICPVDCIEMKEDEEGFLYPEANDKCIKCDKCKKVCPLYNEIENNRVKLKSLEAYGGILKNKLEWEKSTSGGAFTGICKTFDEEIYIFGASFKNLEVIHTSIQGYKELDKFRKSKYIQSDTRQTFREVKKLLQLDKEVIYSGTPCQIAGLVSFLGKDYPNLYCIDLICHGVGSPRVFKECIKNIEKKYKQKIIEYKFRNRKIFLGRLRDIHVSSYLFKNGKKIYKKRDEYNQLFLQQLCIRECCGENCKFRKIERFGDITIADLKNKKETLPQIEDEYNYSTLIINTEKGKKILKKLYKNMELYECDIENIKKFNPLIYRHTFSNPMRNNFFEDFVKGEKLEILIEKYVEKTNRFQRIKRKLSQLKKFLYNGEKK